MISTNVNHVANRGSHHRLFFLLFFFIYGPEGVLVISTHSFDEAICGQTRVEGEKERKPGCPGTDLRLLHLHTDGCESPRGGG